MPSSTARRISGSSSVEVRARSDWWTVASSWSWRSRGWSGGGAGISPPAVTTARGAAATAARLAPSLPASGRHDPQAERPRGGGGTDSGARDQLVPGGDVALQLRHHLAGEEPQARLGEIVGHAAVAEDAVERLGAGALLAVEHLPVALLGRAVDLEAEEELRHRVDSARRGHPLLHLLVGLVAAHLRQMVADELVVLDDGAPVGADVAAAELLGPARVLVAERPASNDRRRRIRAVHLAVDPAVVVQLPRHHVPRLLRDDQEADAEPGHDDGRLGRDRGGVGPAAKRLERPRSELAPLLLHEAAVELAIAAFEALEDHLRRLAEDRAAVLLVHAEPFELHAPEPATEAEDQAPVRHVIEHHHLLGHAQGAVPGQHHHHRAELDSFRAPGEVREVEEDVGAHRVVGEVVFDAPQRFEPERLGEIAEAKLVPVDVAIGSPFALALNNAAQSDVHRAPLPGGRAARFRPRARSPRHHRPGLREASSMRGDRGDARASPRRTVAAVAGTSPWGATTRCPDGAPGLRRTAPPWRARGGGCRTPRRRARARPAPWRRAARDRRGARAARRRARLHRAAARGARSLGRRR